MSRSWNCFCQKRPHVQSCDLKRFWYVSCRINNALGIVHLGSSGTPWIIPGYSLDTQNLSCWSIALTPKIPRPSAVSSSPSGTADKLCTLCLLGELQASSQRLRGLKWHAGNSSGQHLIELHNYMEKHGNNRGLEGPRGNGNGAAPPGAGTKIFRHRLHISPSLFFYRSYCRNFLPSIFERALLLVSPPSPHGMSKCKRFSVTANQHDASSIVELSLPLTLPSPKKQQHDTKSPQCGFPYVLPPFSSHLSKQFYPHPSWAKLLQEDLQ